MDSITQIALGAAVGELCLGKKIGNRAMLWGGIAGTIPDLDVLGGFFMSELEALSFHRGISHSIFFAISFSLLMAYLVNKFYKAKIPERKGFRLGLGLIGGLMLALAGLGLTIMLLKVYETVGLIIAIPFLAGMVYLGKKMYDYVITPKFIHFDVSFKEWYWFFLWTIFTHPILDCFTAYGTQLFAPFSDTRVAWSNISVADPLYTLPFLIALSMASKLPKSQYSRRKFIWISLMVSSLYMVLTIWNKHKVEQVLVNTLDAHGIEFTRITTNPTILNNVLWSGTAQAGDVYYIGSYSIFDREKRFKLERVERNAKLIDNRLDDPTIAQLRWFSNDFYGFEEKPNGELRFNDLRYGTLRTEGKGKNVYVFRFVIEKTPSGFSLLKSLAGPDVEERKSMLSDLWKRMKGV